MHLVDMDAQGSLTRAFGQCDDSDRLYSALSDRERLPVDPIDANLTLTPSTIELLRAETELLTEPGREFFLRTCLEKTALPQNAVVLIDTPPSLGVLSANCLTASGGLLTVVQPGGFELHALCHLHLTVEAIQQRVNHDLCILGAVITNAHRRRAITGKVTTEFSRLYPILGTVRTDARLLQATSSGNVQRLTRSNALDDYGDVARRLQEMLS